MPGNLINTAALEQ